MENLFFVIKQIEFKFLVIHKNAAGINNKIETNVKYKSNDQNYSLEELILSTSWMIKRCVLLYVTNKLRKVLTVIKL